jgi:6-pyruvoyltetrahydropterin/6-carboxytetrahydropterin synthase
MITRREFRFEASHILPDHPGKCRFLHGHSYRFRVSIDTPVRRETGMTLDFDEIDRSVTTAVLDVLDHHHLNDVLPNPTAELIAVWIWEALRDELPGLVEIELWEIEDCSVVYRGEKEIYG